jgi:ribosomal protein S18 acetylase RimI-like enzyme
MRVRYYKRFRMVIDLNLAAPPESLPLGYSWVPWHTALIEEHARVKYRCFHNELDALIFPCLGDRVGCRQLMEDICSRSGFVPQATWLIAAGTEYVGTVQGVADQYGIGMIQNLGVVPEARGVGLGLALLLKALEGFREAGLDQAMLDVTAQNSVAVRLYRRVGFRRAKTLYKAVQTV